MIKKNQVILSHPTGNANVRAIAKSLYLSDLLAGFYTSIASFPGNIYHFLSRFDVFSELGRCTFDPKLSKYTHTYPWFDVGRHVSHKIGMDSLVKHEEGLFCVESIYSRLDRHVASKLKRNYLNQVNGVYAYEDGALLTFTNAKSMGINCIYELPIAYWETGRKLLMEEADRLPTWAPTLAGGIRDSSVKLDKKTKELELADLVVVPSKFVFNSLPDWSKSKPIIVSPFGTPVSSTCSTRKKDSNKPLKILFVGSMGQRKGLADLFAAIKLLNTTQLELIVLGTPLAPMRFYKHELPIFTFEAGRSHQEVLELMNSCDVFCLPSIVEGRALVIQEAMSQGLPIIITPNTGGEDLVIEGETGFLVSIRSPETIAEKLHWFLENRSKISEMGFKARELAFNYTWDRYGEKIVNSINTL